MHLLECYRAVLLQLPSRFYPATLLGGIATLQQDAEDERQLLLRAMTTYDLPEVRIETPEVSIRGLCSLALLASHGRRLPGSLLALLESPTAVDSKSDRFSSMGWQQEYIELALQKWRVIHTAPPTASAQLLFHVIHLNLYCSFAEIERTSRASRKDKGKPIAQVHDAHQGCLEPHFENTVDFERPDSQRAALLQKCFNTAENLDKATWHASQILDIASSIELVSFLPSNGRVHLRREVRRIKHGEPLHFSHAVYHATMVLRLSSLLETSFQRYGEQVGGSEIDSISRKGARLLSRSGSRAAGVFKQVLESLQTSA